uniref:Uncharacterized protein n=1 Tax=Salarias fasciatus TaxID=181472 RepID=A0A672FDG7_SALFA
MCLVMAAMAPRHRNSVRILSSRERGSQTSGSQRLLQLLVEEKVRWMKWQSQKVELPDSPRSTFLLAFSPDRTLMASTHVNHNIYITEVKTGKCLHSLVGHRRTPWCVTFHPTIPGLVASGCLDGEVRIWDLHGGSESWFTDSNVAVASLAFHPTAQLLLIATNNELHFWDWSRPEPFAVVKTGSDTERVRLVRFDPLGHNLLTAIVNPSNQQSDEDSEVPMDSVEMPHFRQRSFLPSQPVRRTPILHNFLHILSRSPGAAAEPPRPLSDGGGGAAAEGPGVPLAPYGGVERAAPFPGCTQHLGMVCLCGRCSAARVSSLAADGPPAAAPDAPQPPQPAPTFGSARTEPRPPSERASAFTSVYYSAGASLNAAAAAASVLEPHPANRYGPDRRPPDAAGSAHRALTPSSSALRPGPDWTRNLLGVRDGGGVLPPRTSSSSSISLLSVLRQQDGSAHSPVYTSASDSRGFPPPPGEAGARDAAGTSSGHHPFWDGARGSSASFRNVLQCNLSRYFMEFDRMQELEPPLGGAEPGPELLNNNLDPDRAGPGPSPSPAIIHYQPPLPPPPSAHSLENNVPPAPPAGRGHLNRCRACHNLLTFNHDSQRWERTSQASSTSAGPPLEPPPPPPAPSSSSWLAEDRRTLEAERRAGPEPGERPPPPGGGAVAFPIAPPPGGPGEQTVGLVYNQDTAQWERVYRQAAAAAAAGRAGEPPEALSQEMPVDPPDEDSLRRRLLESSLLSLSRYDVSGSRDHPIYPDPARLSPAAYYAQRMIQYLSRRDSIRQRSLRYQQNRLRVMSSSSDGPAGAAPGSVDGGDVDFEELDDGGERARHRTTRNARMSAPSLGRFVPRRFLLPEYLPYAGIFHERGQPGLATHSSVNRVLAGASIGDGQSAVASNIANTTYRLQWWDFTKFDLPEISNASVNVLVPNCKIYNDASCDISADGQLLAVFIPSSQRGFPDEGILAIYSLAAHNLGEMLYTKRFGPNAISVSLSPLGCYVMVGLASRRILLHPTTDHMVAQVFRLQQPHGGETSIRMVFNVVYPMAPDQRRHVSINSARWLPDPGMGLAYGTNKGDLVICRPVNQTNKHKTDHNTPPSRSGWRLDRDMGLMNAIGLQPRNPAPSVTSQGTQTPVVQLQNAETQTERELPEADPPEAPPTSEALPSEGSDPGSGEDALARIRRLIAEGGMTAVVQREQSTTMASMGGFGNNIIVSHRIHRGSQTRAAAAAAEAPPPAFPRPPPPAGAGWDPRGLPGPPPPGLPLEMDDVFEAGRPDAEPPPGPAPSSNTLPAGGRDNGYHGDPYSR